MQLKQDKHGFWYYDELPEGSIMATMDDYNSRIRKFIPGTPIAVKSFYSGLYECYRVNTTVSSNIIPFIEAGRVFFIPRIKN